ncbi:hypothetical protein HNQ51_000532 [Inhella inkyongensis]|uniref:Polyketide cyclase n=1 Tax=Inhella inkyongensis TaxID=392593 RepID=A0A840S3Z4_9BURK|nr:SRPBCC family protein [Inhella inkyongensis]MBB5203239.1 hypothetical protein [Inhella inkyongensis]
MKLLKALFALLLGTLVLLMMGSFLLSPDYAVSRSTVVNAPADKVFPLVNSSQGWAQWGVWYRRDPKMQITPGSQTEGPGASWSWKSESQGNGAMKLTDVVASQKVAYELAIEGFDPSQGSIELQAEGDATRVTWTMTGRMSSYTGRWFALFMDKLVGPDFEGGLANLKQLAEKK